MTDTLIRIGNKDTDKERDQIQLCTDIEPCEHTARRQIPSITKATNPADNLVLYFQAPELWENNFCCLSHSLYGVLSC
jgi:hypothetical protein